MSSDIYGQGVITAGEVGLYVPISTATPSSKMRTINVRISNMNANADDTADVLLYITNQSQPQGIQHVYMPKVISSPAGPIDETAIAVAPGYRIWLVSSRENIVYYVAGYEEDAI